MGFVGLVGMSLLLGLEPALIKCAVVLFESVSRYELGVLPLFLLMAHLCFAAGASRDFFDAAASFVGHRRGGLALATIAGCAGFGAVSGSSLATAATMGLIGLPEMRKRGYSTALATGRGRRGRHARLADPAVRRAHRLRHHRRAIDRQAVHRRDHPGAHADAALHGGHRADRAASARRSRRLRRARPGRERGAALLRVLDLAALVIFVLTGIAVGWFTPTEAASVGASLALVLCAMRKRLTWQSFSEALARTLKTTGMLYVVIIGALIFAVFMSFTGLAEQVSTLVHGLSGGPMVAIIVIAVLLLLFGSVLDGLALMLLTTPILLPIITDLGFSPIWFGIFLVRTMEIGFVHPPIGINLYVIQSIAPDIPLGRVFKGVLPFLAADFLHLAMLIAIPALTLGLPALLS